MKILMLGWEFPPKISGGLGVASQGLAEALTGIGHEVTFLLPKKSPTQVSRTVQLINASDIKPDVAFWKKKTKHVDIIEDVEMGTLLLPYLPAKTFVKACKQTQKVTIKEETTPESDLLESITLTGDYNGNLGAELMKYAMLSVQVAQRENPDIIHAHDWITFRAGLLIKKLIKKPLFVHIHSTEYDRNGIHAQHHVIDEEKKGLETADHIFCVSERLKQTLINQYQVSAEKITVAPNAIDGISKTQIPERRPKNIAFVGRLTQQKSPSTFIDLARDLVSRGHDFHYFIMGDGYLRHELENRANESSFADHVTFTGFLERTQLLKKLSEMDLLIVPSASEPFGLVALEAIMKGIPVAAARGIGAAEFVPDIPQVDRWDHYSYVQLIEQLMGDMPFRKAITNTCLQQAKNLSWEKTAKLVASKYPKHQ